MKKLAILLIAASLMLGTVACGDSGTTSSQTDDSDAVRTDVTVEPAELAEEIKAAYSDYITDTDIDADVLEAVYGVDPAWVESFVGQMPFIGFNSDVLIVIKAVDGKAAEVADALATYKADRIELADEYPYHMPKIRAAEIYTAGNYVCYISLGKTDEKMNDETVGALEHYKEMNKKAIEILDAKLK